MRRSLFLLVGVCLLYLVPSLALQAVYGPSFGFLAGEDCWQPDGSGGWQPHGQPSGPAPSEPSVNVPTALRYVPLFLPAALLLFFLFTPLSRLIDRPEPEAPTEVDVDSTDRHMDEPSEPSDSANPDDKTT